MAKAKPVKRYKKGGSSDKQGSRDRANEDKVIAEKNAAAGFGGGGGDGGGKQGSIGSPQEVAAAIAAKGGDGGGGGGRATSRDSGGGGGGGGKGQPAAAETAQQAQVAAALATPGVQQGIAGLLGVPPQGGGRGAQQSGDLAFRDQDAGKELFAQQAVSGFVGPGLDDISTAPPVGTQYDLYGERPRTYVNPVGRGNPIVGAGYVPPAEPVIPGSVGDYLGLPDFMTQPGARTDIPPSAVDIYQYGGPSVGVYGVSGGTQSRPTGVTNPELSTPPASPNFSDPVINLREAQRVFDEIMPSAPLGGIPGDLPQFDFDAARDIAPPPSSFTLSDVVNVAPPPSAPPAAPVGVPTAAPAAAPSVVTAPSPGAGLTAEQIMADTRNTQIAEVPPMAPMGGGLLAAGVNIANGYGPFPGGLFNGRPIFGEGGFLPADSRSGMSAAEIAAEIAAQGGSDDPVPALEPAAPPAVDPNVMPSDKPAWWPSYLPWPPAPGSPYTPTPRPMPEPVPFTQYGTSYGPLTGAISGAPNPLMMGIGGMVRRR